MTEHGGSPDWVKDAVFYQIFPDRFARSERVPKPGNLEPWHSPPTLHGYKGGDLLGVAERLDYLQELGVTALYFTPVFQSASNHRYHTHDYYRVDPMLGGDAALRELLDRAKERGLRVVLDGVFNHASRGLLQFSDILENGANSAYLDWFHVHRFPLHAYGGGEPGYAAWWNIPALPKFNTANPAVREFLLGVARYWIEFGADGWRLDVPNEIDDDEFWREFRRRCRGARSDAYLVGEIWHDAERWLQGDIFDGVMNYPLTRAIYGLVGRSLAEGELAKSGLASIQRLDAAGFAAAAGRLLNNGAAAGQLNLLASHDTPRLATALCHDGAAVRQALTLLFSLPGAPCIYYGDELGLGGGHDPYCRQAMPWDREESWDHELREYVKRLTKLRRSRAELRRGRVAVEAVGDLVIIRRWLADATDNQTAGALVSLINTAEAGAELPLAALGGPGHSAGYRDLISGAALAAAGANLAVPGRAALILEQLG